MDASCVHTPFQFAPCPVSCRLMAHRLSPGFTVVVTITFRRFAPGCCSTKRRIDIQALPVQFTPLLHWQEAVLDEK